VKRALFFIVSAVVAALCGQSASGGFISNGNFETASGDPLEFTHWSYHAASGTEPNTAAVVQADSVISGNRSAEIVRSGARSIEQQAAEALATFAFEMDFAVFPVTGNNRSMNVLLREGASASSGVMNLRVAANGQLQVYDTSGGTWQAIGSLAANTTTDTGSLLEWNGEDPVMNHLEVVGYLSDPSDRYYHVTLNGSSVYGLRWFSGTSPAAISYIQLNGASSASNWLVDNVFFGVPEPSSTAMLAMVLLLALAPWRRGAERLNGTRFLHDPREAGVWCFGGPARQCRAAVGHATDCVREVRRGARSRGPARRVWNAWKEESRANKAAVETASSVDCFYLG
jgi:hypothetical protein